MLNKQNDCNKDVRKKRNKSCNVCKYLKRKPAWKKNLAKYMINNLKNYGPCNQMYIKALCNITGKSIRIYKSNGNLYRTIDNDRKNNETCKPVDIEYHQERHWTLLGNKEPTKVETDLNACLFAVIAAQTGRSVNDLRTSTIEFLTNNANYLTDEIDKLLSVDTNDVSLMIGGARYNGTSPRAAGIILDRSQNALCDGCRVTGHPRGHASDKDATGPADSVENYSRTSGSMKSGFLSKDDQNKVAHFALSHERSIRAMENLNRGGQSEAVTLNRRELNIDLPKMKEFVNGEPYTGEMDIIQVTLVMRHHLGKRDDPNADVFVHTIYPRSR
ncbi:uncharacterized protein LOC143265258 [Megachile rotundata]|uniref:uncharacterized protein LOC143265258 n=1 Tax=Megachile rotundata TaxID=143995 RepID=UPI003FCEED54